jgi:hypothetical protein
MGHIVIPYETLKLMHTSIYRDQGNLYRSFLGVVLPAIGDAYRSDEDAFRSHMGASILGKDCGRAIWYSWRWVAKSKFSAQMLRLFNRGHLEEGRFIALLLAMGCQVYQQDDNGKQYRISHLDDHIGGSGDGVVIGIPDVTPGMPVLGEFKTHNEKSFTALAGKDWRKHLNYHLGLSDQNVPFDGDGVKESKFEHYVQMQMYMFKMGLAVCLYVAVNKNTDDIYCELVPLDSKFAEQFFNRGETLVISKGPPEKLSKSPGFYKCKMCDMAPVCHLGAQVEMNCRTCAFSVPVFGEPGAQWHCNERNKRLSKADQLAGCEKYVKLPSL